MVGHEQSRPAHEMDYAPEADREDQHNSLRTYHIGLTTTLDLPLRYYRCDSV